MVADLSKYAGREQAWVKHFFLEGYLESLAHKAASKFEEICYVDGFSGPWQSSGENFEDTSFGIALNTLRKAKGAWKALNREVRVSAYLVEKNRDAYAQLEAIKSKYPDIAIHTYHGDFVTKVEQLRNEIPKEAFAFLFVDPKGWAIEMKELAPLLSRANSEVLFNFMFDFINRAAAMQNNRALMEALGRLMPYGEWQARLPAAATPEERRLVLVDAFRETLATLGNYQFVADIPVLRPLQDRTLYPLVYATRHPTGLEVFRSWHVKTERAQASTRSTTKRAQEQATTQQGVLFDDDVPLGPNLSERFLEDERRAARTVLLSLAPLAPQSITYGSLWPQVLAQHVVTRADVNAIAAELRKEGKLTFLDWGDRDRVPKDPYRASRKPVGSALI